MLIPKTMDRRSVLRGMMGGAAVTVGVPFLDCFLNGHGTALANGTALPVCFGSWFQGLGFTPGFWEPKKLGAGYEMMPLLDALTPYKDKINIFSGMKAYLDGRALTPHTNGPQAILSGGIPRGQPNPGITIDQLVADVIGTRTRFRSLEVSCVGSTQSQSRRDANSTNPSESNPLALYTRVFGPDFKDPNAADFTPDPAIMVRRSALSAVTEQRKDLAKQLGATDRARLDEYFTALRELENKLELELQKPAPLEACKVPGKTEETTQGAAVERAHHNHRLFAGLMANALACGQTRIVNIMFSGAVSELRMPNNVNTYHITTHEETADPSLGYQPMVGWFQTQIAEGYKTAIEALANIKEGDRTLLDRSLLMFSTDHGFAKLHSLENIAMMTAGGANGRLKTGYHIQAQGDTVARVGLTVQQALGVPVSSWGYESNHTGKSFTELLA
jgi:hypothetical protein